MFSPCESAELGQEREKNSSEKKKGDNTIHFCTSRSTLSLSKNLGIKLEQMQLNMQNRLRKCIANALSGVQ